MLMTGQNLQDINFPAIPQNLTRSPARISAAERNRLLQDAEDAVTSSQDRGEDGVAHGSRSNQGVS